MLTSIDDVVFVKSSLNARIVRTEPLSLFVFKVRSSSDPRVRYSACELAEMQRCIERGVAGEEDKFEDDQIIGHVLLGRDELRIDEHSFGTEPAFLALSNLIHCFVRQGMRLEITQGRFLMRSTS